MLAKKNILLGLVMTSLLGGGLLVSYHLLADDPHEGCGKEGHQGEGYGKCQRHKGEVTSDEPTPETLLKEADTLIKELDKAKDDNAKEECYKKIMTHAVKLSEMAPHLLAECNEMLQSESLDTEGMIEKTIRAIMLLKKSAELTQKCHEWLAKQSKKAGLAKAEIVPHKITASEIGKEVKCPVMGSVFKVRKNTQAYVKVTTAWRVKELYEKTLIPPAGQTLATSQVSYQTGQADFLNLLDSVRMLLDLKLGFYQDTMDYKKTLAEPEFRGALPVEEVSY